MKSIIPAYLLTAVILALPAGLARASYTFDLILPTEIQINTANTTGGSVGLTWLVVTSGTLPNADLAASQRSVDAADPALLMNARPNGLFNLDGLGDLETGDVAGPDFLSFTLEPGEALVTGSTFSNTAFNWSQTSEGTTTLDGSWQIGDQIATFTIPVVLTDTPGGVNRTGQQRVSSTPIPEPSSLALLALGGLLAARRRRG